MATPVRTRARRWLRGSGPAASGPVAAIHGSARLGRRTKQLVKRLDAGDVAIIDHADLDRIAAEDLVATGVRAVVNVSPFSTGRYPNTGPLLMARAGVRLVDAPAAPLFEELQDGDPVAIVGGEVRRNGTVLAAGRVLAPAELAEQLSEQRRRIDEALAAFAENTMTHLREEGELLAGRTELPRTRTVVPRPPRADRGQGNELSQGPAALRAYIRDVRPVLVGVDGGADAILEVGLKPDVVLGDMDSASDEALRSGAELVVHAYPDGHAPGRARLERLGLEHRTIRAVGTSEDVAMLLASEKGAGLIVSVGAHFNLVEFLEQGARGDVVDLPHAAAGGRAAGRRQGGEPALQPGRQQPPDGALLRRALVLLAIVIVTTRP